MATNIVCSDTYIDAFSRLDKKTQKKSLETIRLMKRSLRSDSLKVEKLNTKLDLKSARVTQDFRAIFTQSGNTVLLVYIDHHDDAYLWASNRLQGFDAKNAKPAYEYFEQSKSTLTQVTDETIRIHNNIKSDKPIDTDNYDSKTCKHLDLSDKQQDNLILNNVALRSKQDSKFEQYKKFFLYLFFFLLGAVVGIIITFIHLM